MVKYKAFTEDGKCIFCAIIKGDIQTPGIFWEDENFLAFLSLFPNTSGATVLITKSHFDSNVLELSDDELCHFIKAAKTVSNILKKYFNDVGRIGLVMEGMGINHAHIKLFPMHGTEFLNNGKWKQINSNKLDFFDKYEGYLMSNDSVEANHEELACLALKLRKI
jgi:histidine triad (HIT) family protein